MRISDWSSDVCSSDLPPVGEALLEAKGVRVSFRRPGWRGGWFDAVSDAALDIRVGETVALVGGSGSGKSTLARAIAGLGPMQAGKVRWQRSEEHTSELQSLMRNSYAVFCLKKKKQKTEPQATARIY